MLLFWRETSRTSSGMDGTGLACQECYTQAHQRNSARERLYGASEPHSFPYRVVAWFTVLQRACTVLQHAAPCGSPEDLCEDPTVQLLVLCRERTDEDRHQREVLFAHDLREAVAYNVPLLSDMQRDKNVLRLSSV